MPRVMRPMLSKRGRRAVAKFHKMGVASPVNMMLGEKRLSENQLVSLSNMWHERTKYILRLMNSGHTFAAADKASKENQIYDTCSWGEVTSRLGRGSGSVQVAVATLLACREVFLSSPDQAAAVAKHAAELIALSRQLCRLVCGTHEFSFGNDADLRKHHKSLRNKVGNGLSYPQVVGKLKLCTAYLKKNIRDVPEIPLKTGKHITEKQREKIRMQLVDINRSCELLRSRRLPK